VVLCMVDGHAGKPCFRGGVELTGQPGFHDRYALERFRAHGEHDFVSTIWVRRAGRVGIRRTRERQIVPGHMLATDQGFAEFSGGRFGATLPAGSEVVLPLLEACTDCSVALEAAGVGTATLRSPRELAVTAVGPLHVRSVRLDYKR